MVSAKSDCSTIEAFSHGLEARVTETHLVPRASSPCQRRLPTSLARIATLFFLFFLCRPAAAHPEGFSGLAVDVEVTHVRASLTLYTRELNAWFPPRMYPNYVADVCRE